MNDAMGGVSAVIFDLEGVILDTEPVWDEAQQALLSRRGCRYDRSELKHRIIGLGGEQAIAVFIDHYRLPDEPSMLLHERREIMTELLAREIRYVPGALDFVRDSAAVVDVCVATSMEPGLLDVVKASGLSAVFPWPIFTPASVGGIAKPAPDLFLHAASELGAKPADCVVVEDSPHGIAAARAAGIPCIALCTTLERSHLSGADLVFDHWGEVPRLSGEPGKRSTGIPAAQRLGS